MTRQPRQLICMMCCCLLQVRAICEAKPTGAGCAQCMPDWAAGKKWANCDLLAVYSGLCGADPSKYSLMEVLGTGMPIQGRLAVNHK